MQTIRIYDYHTTALYLLSISSLFLPYTANLFLPRAYTSAALSTFLTLSLHVTPTILLLYFISIAFTFNRTQSFCLTKHWRYHYSFLHTSLVPGLILFSSVCTQLKLSTPHFLHSFFDPHPSQFLHSPYLQQSTAYNSSLVPYQLLINSLLMSWAPHFHIFTRNFLAKKYLIELLVPSSYAPPTPSPLTTRKRNSVTAFSAV